MGASFGAVEHDATKNLVGEDDRNGKARQPRKLADGREAPFSSHLDGFCISRPVVVEEEITVRD